MTAGEHLLKAIFNTRLLATNTTDYIQRAQNAVSSLRQAIIYPREEAKIARDIHQFQEINDNRSGENFYVYSSFSPPFFSFMLSSYTNDFFFLIIS